MEVLFSKSTKSDHIKAYSDKKNSFKKEGILIVSEFSLD